MQTNKDIYTFIFKTIILSYLNAFPFYSSNTKLGYIKKTNLLNIFIHEFFMKF